MNTESTLKLTAVAANAGAWSITMADVNEVLTALSLLAAIAASIAVMVYNIKKTKRK